VFFVSTMLLPVCLAAIIYTAVSKSGAPGPTQPHSASHTPDLQSFDD
jgi:hypothetical protein